MDQEELKRKLMGLWEKTTHTSKELLGILFEYYFDVNFIEYKESEGKIVSALCGIPYNFGFGDKKLKGLYIISLSSEEGFRKKGILSELLEKFNDKVRGEFDFTFLVPATELLADYYVTQGYFSSFFILEERYTPLHDFRHDFQLSLLESDERIRLLKSGLLDEIKVYERDPNRDKDEDAVVDFILEIEKKGSSAINLCHSPKDLHYALSGDSLRNLTSFIAYDADGNISGVGFTQKEDLKRVRVVAFYVTDVSVYYALLDCIKHKYPDYSISVNTSDPKYQSHSLIQDNYVSVNPAGGDLDNTFSTVEMPFNINRLLQPMGMVKLLGFDNIMNYIAASRSDVDFNLSIRDIQDNINEEIKGKKKVYSVKNGKCKVQYLEYPFNDKNILNLSQKEISELLLRKNDSSNLIMEAFGIPRLDLQIRLLP